MPDPLAQFPYDQPRMLTRAHDSAAEKLVCEAIGRALGCELHSFGGLDPIDRYALRGERLVGLLEVKCRTHALGTYPDVYLSVRKWLGLLLGGTGLGVPGLFAVGWTDAIGWVAVSDVDARRHQMGGRRDMRRANDREPVVRVPVWQFTMVDSHAE